MTNRDESTGSLPERADPDEALRVAIKAAVDAGQLDRAARLLEVLRATPPAGEVVDLTLRGGRG